MILYDGETFVIDLTQCPVLKFVENGQRANIIAIVENRDFILKRASSLDKGKHWMQVLARMVIAEANNKDKTSVLFTQADVDKRAAEGTLDIE